MEKPFAKDLARFDAAARAALAKDAESAPLYIEHHLSELPAAKIKSLFGSKTPPPAKFLSSMILTHVALHPNDAKRFAVLDYTLPKDVTNYLLVVTFNAKGNVTAVDMES